MLKPLFPGDSEIDELFKIFQVLGTPNEESWPGVRQLPEYKDVFPQWRARQLHEVVPQLCDDGIDLLARMLTYEPSKRISAKQALQHPFLRDLNAAFCCNV